MNQITITQTTESTLKVEFFGELKYTDVQTMLLNACVSAINMAKEQVPEEHQRAFLESAYDRFNEQASAALELILPEQELRPDMDEQAILAYEEARIKAAIEEGLADGTLHCDPVGHPGALGTLNANDDTNNELS